MAKKPTTGPAIAGAAHIAAHQELPDAVEDELMQLRHIVGLAAFAAEARRVLREVELVAEMMPQAQAALNTIEARSQWIDHPDTADQVLCDVYDRLGTLLMGGGGGR